MADTRTKLLDAATELVRSRGYSAFSYADLASAVKIRKASIHYHFPTKEDLGAELVSSWRAQSLAKMDRIGRDGRDTFDKLERYSTLYRADLPHGLICPCGALAAEADAIPERVRAEVDRFFEASIAWLTRTLAEGGARAEVRVDVDPAWSARSILSTFQGALIVARSMADTEFFDEVVSTTLARLRP
ncbi:TetR/AcrR family transcriptional regulator [Pseudonocardia asaccharolytica]|uniref:TetR family transcriptional regulator n=1 Tax=Pseudonocardia asaccharolytica DSM 44247 = NBRC 16224 TaxID=1123024 RepID=A0A511D0D7_9PSEU|nr:TetR/AcrR family transcriptional regulator [Pseudonocardia asaccharolytica]GEL17004.1 TetR family transcriptional regulator [Pseudonocardia asaccharolytica DSM 44247 = NBRC 16224]